jgi:hypothetical protein
MIKINQNIDAAFEIHLLVMVEISVDTQMTAVADLVQSRPDK